MYIQITDHIALIFNYIPQYMQLIANDYGAIVYHNSGKIICKLLQG